MKRSFRKNASFLISNSWLTRFRNWSNDPIIKYKVANLGCLLVCTFGNFIGPVLVAAHTFSNLGSSNEQTFENVSKVSVTKNIKNLDINHEQSFENISKVSGTKNC